MTTYHGRSHPCVGKVRYLTEEVALEVAARLPVQGVPRLASVEQDERTSRRAGMNSKQQRQTRTVELVETGNIAISLHRLQNAGAYDTERWKRALYHAVCMATHSSGEKEAIRKALGLP